jgi:hypothetical protein
MKVYRNRSGIEATNSTIKKNGLGQLRVRGLKAVNVKVLFKALALNVRQITAYLNKKSRKLQVKSAKKAGKNGDK